MRCISPLTIVRNGRRDVVPCGKCNFCLATIRSDWTFRLQQEEKRSVSAHFLTLTYENPPVSESGEYELRKEDFQLFMKKFRQENPHKVRYYAVGEYGTITQRPHYHAIMFNTHPVVLNRLEKIWNHGITHIGDVSTASIHYVTKYVINKPGEYEGREKPFALMSRRPGIGHDYVNTHRAWHNADMRNFVNVNGIPSRVPRYYKKKLFEDYDLKHIARQSVSASAAQYSKDLMALEKFHSDPVHYYDERINHMHEVMHSRINSKDKF